MPLPGQCGRMYYATDLNMLYFDTGKGWISVSPVLLESFTVNTDANGKATVTLSHTPRDDNSIALWCKTPLRYAEFVSRSGNSLTVLIRKIGTRYDRCSRIDCNTLPSGVTVQTGSSIATSGPSSISDRVYGACTTTTGYARFGTDSHIHVITQIFEHEHIKTPTPLGSDPADLKAVNETGIVLIVTYAV